jgi:hypothetical protein
VGCDQSITGVVAVETAPEGKVMASHVERAVEAFQETGLLTSRIPTKLMASPVSPALGVSIPWLA